MRRLAIPDAAAMLGLHPSEVRGLVEAGRLEGVQAGGRWLISRESVLRLGADSSEPDLNDLEARVADLERRLEMFESTHRVDAGDDRLRPALQPLFRTTE
ncbi:MAG: helix-turn-helix domain-containing protein [Solirubrobacteraceae bacterium]